MKYISNWTDKLGRKRYRFGARDFRASNRRPVAPLGGA
jgi:hypothetical protein